MDLIDAFTKAAMPTVIVFTKCDNPRPSWQITQGMMENLCATFDYIESFEASINSPETHKRCISIMMRNVMSELNSEFYKFSNSISLLHMIVAPLLG